MPYQMSRARKALQQTYDEINERLRAAENRSVDVKLREYVIAASIFLAHAEIENFIADLFSAFAVSAHRNAAIGSKLPRNLQAHLFLLKSNAKAIFGNFASSNSEKQLLSAFSNALRSVPGSVINDAVALAPFSGKDLVTSIKYPSEENLKKLFYRLGVDNLFDRLSHYLRQDSRALLMSIGSLRTQLAHTGVLPGVSCRDVRSLLRDTKKFVGAVDREMFRVTVSSFGVRAWTNYLC
jgi:hypothetical protein